MCFFSYRDNKRKINDIGRKVVLFKSLYSISWYIKVNQQKKPLVLQRKCLVRCCNQRSLQTNSQSTIYYFCIFKICFPVEIFKNETCRKKKINMKMIDIFFSFFNLFPFSFLIYTKFFFLREKYILGQPLLA